VAEDIEESRTLLVTILNTVGFDVKEAADGKEAVEIFNQWRPNFIWMDIRMPVMNGLEANRHIKSTRAGKSTIVVVLTAHALEEEREQIMAAGCDDFVRKPFHEQEIFEVMAKHLGVKYVYEEQEEAVPVELEAAIQPEQLAALPADLLGQLHKTVLELDHKQILVVLERIKTVDAKIVKGLNPFVRNLAYGALLDLIEKCNPSREEDCHG
jgi:CheY-like chemotaxis protein